MRKYLFFMSIRVVVLSKYFQNYYQRKLEIKNRASQQPKRNEILCAVAIKLIKVIFAQPFSVEDPNMFSKKKTTRHLSVSMLSVWLLKNHHQSRG